MVNLLNEIKKKVHLQNKKNGHILGTGVKKTDQNLDIEKNQRIEEKTKIYLKCWFCDSKVNSDPVEFQTHTEECAKMYKSENDNYKVKLFKTFNDEENITSALVIISKCVENILNNPNEIKYRRMRIKNKTLSEKVLNLKYGLEVFLYLGFIIENVSSEEFLVFSNIENEFENLRLKLNIVQSLEKYKTQLFSRNLKINVYNSKELKNIQSLIDSEIKINDNSIFDPDIKEITKDYLNLKKQNELNQTLMTKEQREKFEIPKKKLPIPVATTLKIKLPDNSNIEAIFLVNETILNVFDFLKMYVKNKQVNFLLYSTSTSSKIKNDI